MERDRALDEPGAGHRGVMHRRVAVDRMLALDWVDYAFHDVSEVVRVWS